jgi:hypothetical protein
MEPEKFLIILYNNINSKPKGEVMSNFINPHDPRHKELEKALGIKPKKEKKMSGAEKKAEKKKMAEALKAGKIYIPPDFDPRQY